MKKIFLFLSTTLFLTTATSYANEMLWRQHCQDVASDPDIFLKKLSLSENRISFTNHGGLFNGGVCWWHSRLTRVIQYLAVFDPSGAPLSEDDAYKVVKKLRQGKPVTITGYKNFSDFSRSHAQAVQKNLEDWQISSGGFQLGFLDGLSGSTSVPADEMKKLMDEAYAELSQNRRPIFQVLQLPGVTAHSWLLFGMRTTMDGYQFQVVDSNYFSTQTWTYKNGATGFYYGSSPFVNYTTFRGKVEETVLSERLAETCAKLKSKGVVVDTFNDLDAEIDQRMKAPRP